MRREASIAASKKVKFVFAPSRDLPAHDLVVIQQLLNAETLETILCRVQHVTTRRSGIVWALANRAVRLGRDQVALTWSFGRA